MKWKKLLGRKVSPGLWGKRIDELIKACGWGLKEIEQKFGKSWQNIQDMRFNGSRPIQPGNFMRRLMKLEEVYKTELELYRSGGIVYENGRRIVWAKDELERAKRRFRRPEDLRSSPSVGTPRPDRGMESGSGRSSKLDSETAPGRAEDPGYFADRPGSSGSASAAGRTSEGLYR